MITSWLPFQLPIEFRPYPNKELPFPYISRYQRGTNPNFDTCNGFDGNPALEALNSFVALTESYCDGIDVKIDQVATEDCGFQTQLVIIQRQAIAWVLIDTLVLNNTVKIVVKDICICDSNAV